MNSWSATNSKRVTQIAYASRDFASSGVQDGLEGTCNVEKVMKSHGVVAEIGNPAVKGLENHDDSMKDTSEKSKISKQEKTRLHEEPRRRKMLPQAKATLMLKESTESLSPITPEVTKQISRSKSKEHTQREVKKGKQKLKSHKEEKKIVTQDRMKSDLKSKTSEREKGKEVEGRNVSRGMERSMSEVRDIINVKTANPKYKENTKSKAHVEFRAEKNVGGVMNIKDSLTLPKMDTNEKIAKKNRKRERKERTDRRMEKSKERSFEHGEVKKGVPSQSCWSCPTLSELDPELFPWTKANEWLKNYTIPKLKNKQSDSKSTDKSEKRSRRKVSRKRRGHRHKSGYEADDSSEDEEEDAAPVGESHSDSGHQVPGHHADESGDICFTINNCRKRKLVFESESEDEDVLSVIAEDLGLGKDDLAMRLSVRQRREVELVDRRLSSSDEDYMPPSKHRKHDKHWQKAMRILDHYRDSSGEVQAQKRKSSDTENDEMDERKRMRV